MANIQKFRKCLREEIQVFKIYCDSNSVVCDDNMILSFFFSIFIGV